jgi:peptidoglycan/LPS O-acetylase OafA/YrhL
MTHYAPMVFVGVGLWILGATGVSLFFVLSGFVFAPYFERGSMDYIAHLIRRVFRLFPLYLCALLVYVALHEPTNRWQYFWPHVFMFAHAWRARGNHVLQRCVLELATGN